MAWWSETGKPFGAANQLDKTLRQSLPWCTGVGEERLDVRWSISGLETVEVLGTSCKDFITWGALPRARWPHLDRSPYTRSDSTVTITVFSHDHFPIHTRKMALTSRREIRQTSPPCLKPRPSQLGLPGGQKMKTNQYLCFVLLRKRLRLRKTSSGVMLAWVESGAAV